MNPASSTPKNQQGFSILTTTISLAVIAILAFAGYYVWDKQKEEGTSNRPRGSTESEKKELEEKPSERTFSLYDGRIVFIDDGTWKKASGGYWSIENGRCGRSIDFDPGCLDHFMLIPSTDKFTNPDQFQVNVSVFRDDRAPGVSLGQWIDSNIGVGGTNPSISYPKINDSEAYRYEVAYDENDIRLVYGIVVGDTILVVQSNFFKGNHQSYQTTTDYTPFIPKVDELVSSLRK